MSSPIFFSTQNARQDAHRILRWTAIRFAFVKHARKGH